MRSSKTIEEAHVMLSRLLLMICDWEKPATHAPIHNSRARMRVTAGQYSSHLVYCSSSLFWQHLEGQHWGHAQQQNKNGERMMIKTSPSMNGPIKPATCTVFDCNWLMESPDLPWSKLLTRVFLNNVRRTRREWTWISSGSCRGSRLNWPSCQWGWCATCRHKRC